MINLDPQKIVKRREQLGMTREELAVKAGVPYGSLTTLELGYNEPKVNTVARIAEALGVELPSELFSPHEIPIGRPAATGGGR